MKIKSFEKLIVPEREPKPRSKGITMVLDKNLGLRGIRDLVETAGEYIDIMKFGWGTTRMLPKRLLKSKIRILRDNEIEVCNGGTLTEFAFLQGKFKDYLGEMATMGYTVVEISDGTINMGYEERLELITQAKEQGFKVVTEVGKKSPSEDSKLTVQKRVELIKRDLKMGVDKVVLEARESGTVGIFDNRGEVVIPRVLSIIKSVNVNDLIFEAPKKKQQVYLILNIGPNVNLGNISPLDVISVETLRRGLRGDTFGKV